MLENALNRIMADPKIAHAWNCNSVNGKSSDAACSCGALRTTAEATPVSVEEMAMLLLDIPSFTHDDAHSAAEAVLAAFNVSRKP